MMPLLPSITPDRPFYTNDNNYIPLPHWKQPANFNHSQSSHLSELPSLELLGEIAATRLITTQIPQSTTSAYVNNATIPSRDTSSNHKSTSTRIVNLSKTLKSTTTEKAIEQIDTDELENTTSSVTEVEMTTFFPSPIETNTTEDSIELSQEIESNVLTDSQAEIRASKEGAQIKLEWDAPEKTICDNYLVNTTILSSKKSFSTASANPYSYIKFYNGERITVFFSVINRLEILFTRKFKKIILKFAKIIHFR